MAIDYYHGNFSLGRSNCCVCLCNPIVFLDSRAAVKEEQWCYRKNNDSGNLDEMEFGEFKELFYKYQPPIDGLAPLSLPRMKETTLSVEFADD